MLTVNSTLKRINLSGKSLNDIIHIKCICDQDNSVYDVVNIHVRKVVEENCEKKNNLCLKMPVFKTRGYNY